MPQLGAWQKRPACDETDVREWLATGHNLGFRTGVKSGYIVIDDDQIRAGVPEPDRWVPPPTDMVSWTPTNGYHYWYRTPHPCPGNSASKLAPHVDVRGEGGQVVYPGSTHPNGGTYKWIKTGIAAELPIAIVNQLTRAATVRIDTTKPAPPPPETRGVGYGETAMIQEIHKVRTAPEGSRNNILNTAAFNLGQLVGGGVLGEKTVRDELAAAAKLVGLEEKETFDTIDSGIKAGIAKPRRAPERQVTTKTRERSKLRAKEKPDVLVPGSHILDGGEYVEQGSHTFASQVLEQLPGGTIYRRAGTIGRVVDGAFVVIHPDRMRSVVDRHVRLALGKQGKDDDDPVLVYKPCSGDNGRLVLAYAEDEGSIRELEHLASHPVLVGPDYELARPGWNEESNTYLAADEQPIPLDLSTAKAVLEDLVVDFPWKSSADRSNYFGLLLTPLLRPALREPVPMHLIGSPIERTGKSKLASIVFGISITGHPLPDAQIGVREEEREKRITALLLSGASCAHLDNLTHFIDSAALASLLTSTRYQGRELNYSRMLTLPNQLTIVGTGNNVHATGEIAKRVVPISLESPLESPETRQDYVHPDLRSYVEENRPRVLGALLGLVESWKAAGRPRGSVPMGGFERWAAVVGGILQHAGYRDWMTNVADWKGGSNEFGGELAAFVGLWLEATEGRIERTLPVAELYDMATGEGLFERDLDYSTEHGRRTAFSQRIMNVIDGRVIAGHRVSLAGKGKRRRATLTPTLEQPSGQPD